MTTLCILGRQPEIGQAELESLYGADNVRAFGDSFACVASPVDFSRLGGSIKAGQVIAQVPTTDIKAAFRKIATLIPTLLRSLPDDGKIKLGVSVYGLEATPYALNGEVLRLKKIIKQKGRSVRAVPNDTLALSSAQTYHNSLTSPLGIELALVRDDATTHIVRVTDVQDIDAYRIRDRERPKRDAFVGMLPPKLAQIIINLAVGQADDTSRTILDPFCGTGVLLQEALLMGYGAYGSDISPKMIDFSRANLTWLREKAHRSLSDATLELADATTHSWTLPSAVAVACEGYLGQPLGGQHPSEEKILSIVHDTNKVMRGFLHNISTQLTTGTRLCVALPAWYINDSDYHLPVLTELNTLGFTRVSFRTDELIYRRDDQITARELVVLTKS